MIWVLLAVFYVAAAGAVAATFMHITGSMSTDPDVILPAILWPAVVPAVASFFLADSIIGSVKRRSEKRRIRIAQAEHERLRIMADLDAELELPLATQKEKL